MSQSLIHRDPRFFPELKDLILNSRILTEEQICHALVTFHLVVDQGHVSVSILHGLNLAIAAIARKWKMKLESSHQIALKPLVTLRPKYGT